MTKSKTTSPFTLAATATTAALAAFLSASSAFALGTETYQVTGPILELTEDVIVVKKGRDKWEIARNSETKVTGDLKVGSKVTIMYRMTAASADVKAPPVARNNPADRVPKLYPADKPEKSTGEKMATDKPQETAKGSRLKKAGAVEAGGAATTPTTATPAPTPVPATK